MTTRVASCQLAIDIDDPYSTRDRLSAALSAAGAAGAGVIVLPELANTGYSFRTPEEAASRAEPVDGEFVSWLRARSAELGCVVVSGWCEAGAGGGIYNSAVVIDHGDIRSVYRKVHLWGREPRFFRPAAERPALVETSVGRLAVMICYDLEFPEWVRIAADAGAELVVVPSNWPATPQPAGRIPLEITKAQAFAGVYKVFVAVADRCGVERDQHWLGGSVIVGPDGDVLASSTAPGFQPAVPTMLVADLDLSLARDKSLGPDNDVRRDRRPELYS